MNLAHFPWDPKPDPPPTPASANVPPASASSSAPPATANYTQPTMSPQSSAQTLSLPGSLHPDANSVGVKQEPGFTQNEPAIKQEPGLPQAPSGYNPANTIAAQRAMSALQNKFGPRAADSIARIGSVAQQAQQNQRHGQMPQQPMNPQQQQQQQQQQQHQQQQQQQQQQHLNAQQQYRQEVAAGLQQRMQQINRAGPNGLPTSQVDGPSDAPETAPSITMDRAQIDELFHEQLAARAKQMEGGGLMLPLKQATKTRSVASKHASAAGPAQVDGGLDDDGDDDDEDAINSDLDDPDEMGEDDEDEDDSMGHMMLCMYDKVQRVKNKWKCILKDGVLTVNGKEYVFAKATGEYEW
ncbi:hypothetical protein VTH82DRAFT_3612 [Thermothelomyces myriococcoides]